MNKLASFLIPFLIATQALAGLPPTTLKGESATTKVTTFNFQAPLNQATQVSGTTSVIETDSDNALANPRFAGGTTGWTSSGGNFTATGTTGTWDSSAASQTLTSTGVVVTTGDEGKSQAYAASCRFKTASGSATHKVQLYDGTNVLNETSITSSTDYTRATATGIAPASGSVYLRVISVASNEPSVDIKNCYLGRAEGFNWAQVSQATFAGGIDYPQTTNCAWSNSGTSMSSFSADTDCPTGTLYGNASDPGSKIPAVKFGSLAPGEYMVVATGRFTPATSGTAATIVFALSDGTNLAGNLTVSAANGATNNVTESSTLFAHFSYTTAQSNLTFQVQSRTSSGSNAAAISNDAAATARAFDIRVFRFPTSTEGVVRGDRAAYSWSGYHDGTCSWARTNNAYGDPAADATCAFTERTNRNFGTVTSYLSGSDKLPGIVFTPNYAGRQFVCASLSAFTSTSTNGFVELSDTSGVLIDRKQNESPSSGTQRIPLTLCGIYPAGSGSTTLRVRSAASGSGTETVDAANSSLQNTIEWSIFSLDAPMPQPLIPGSVFSSSAGVEYVQRAVIANSGTPTISSQSGSWISSLTDNGVGITTLNFAAGTFSAAPTCVANVTNATAFARINAATSTTVQVETQTVASSSADTDQPFNVICMGPH